MFKRLGLYSCSKFWLYRLIVDGAILLDLLIHFLETLLFSERSFRFLLHQILFNSVTNVAQIALPFQFGQIDKETVSFVLFSDQRVQISNSVMRVKQSFSYLEWSVHILGNSDFFMNLCHISALFFILGFCKSSLAKRNRKHGRVDLQKQIRLKSFSIV